MAILQKPKTSEMNCPHVCMNPEMVRLGRIRAAPNTKIKIRILLDINLSLITLLTDRLVVRIFGHFCVLASRYRFDSRAIDKRDETAAAVPDPLLVFPGSIDVEFAAISHLDDSLSRGFTFGGGGFRSRRYWALVQLSGGGLVFSIRSGRCFGCGLNCCFGRWTRFRFGCGN